MRHEITGHEITGHEIAGQARNDARLSPLSFGEGSGVRCRKPLRGYAFIAVCESARTAMNNEQLTMNNEQLTIKN